LKGKGDPLSSRKGSGAEALSLAGARTSALERAKLGDA